MLHHRELIGGKVVRALRIEGAQGQRQSPPLASSQITPWKVRCALLCSHSSAGKHRAHCRQADEQKRGHTIFPYQHPGFAWWADCSNASSLCQEALPEHLLSKNGREYRLLPCEASGLLASSSLVPERPGAEAWKMVRKNGIPPCSRLTILRRPHKSITDDSFTLTIAHRPAGLMKDHFVELFEE